MKHTISRFFRFFLVAALVAAMAGSLLPSKALGQVVTPCVVSAAQACATPSTLSAVATAVGWEIKFQPGAITADTFMDDGTREQAGGALTIEFPANTRMPNSIAKGHIAVASSDDGSMTAADPPVDVAVPVAATPLYADVTPDGTTLTIPSPVAIAEDAMATVTIAAAAKIAHAPAAGEQTGFTANTDPVAAYTTTQAPTVAVTSQNAGAVTQWRIDFQVTNELTADVSEITVKFSHGSVPSSIDRSAISVRRNMAPTVAPADTTAAALLTVAPTRTSSSLTFFTPLGLGGTARENETGTIIISATAGVSHKTSPSAAAMVTVTAGDNNPLTSDGFSVNRYLTIAPTSATRGATVTVSGGGFTAGTSGNILFGPKSTGGVYTVDSGGKLTGSFVTSGTTSGTGKVSVLDLGDSKPIDGSRLPSFTQKASASAAAEATLGAPVSVTLNDFPKGDRLTVTASIAGGIGFGETVIGAEVGDVLADVEQQTASKYSFVVPQANQTPGTKQITIKVVAENKVPGTAEVGATDDDDKLLPTATQVGSFEAVGEESAGFLVTIVSRTLTVSPSSAVPGQAITVSGSGFNGDSKVDLTLGVAGGDTVNIAGAGTDDPQVLPVDVNTDGTFLYTGKVPFADGVTAKDGPKTWTATETPGGARAASSSGFSIQKRAITLSPSTANPGSTVEVFGSGWGVTTQGNATSQVTIMVAGSNASFGPFPISSSGEFTGAFTVPSDVGVQKLTVTATDNNGGREREDRNADQTQSFLTNQKATKELSVPTGVVSVTPNTASTGSVITVTGKGFPAQTNLAVLTFGGSNALPVPAPGTDVQGNFTVTLTVPAASQGGSITPGAVVITARVGQIKGTTSFTIPGPEITLSESESRPGDEITITGTGFSAYSNVDVVNVGQRNQVPTPQPLTDAVGDFSASIRIPALNPGAYTITVRTGSGFTATESIRILSATSGRTVSPEIAFQALTSRGLLTLAAAAAPGGTEFGAFVPGLAGNTLVQVEPNGVLILTLNADVQISVSSQPAVSVSADTPTFFALGAAVTVEVIE